MKIEIYLNGKYLCTTTQSNTCKGAVASLRDRAAKDGSVIIAGISGFTAIKDNDKLTARRYA